MDRLWSKKPSRSLTAGLATSPYIRNRRAVPLGEKFWSRVRKGIGCWIWGGSKNSMGYGLFHIRRGYSVYAHRAVWAMARGPIPTGMCVLHKCDNPPCVRLSHLWIGSQSENVQDMHKKGRNTIRGLKGEMHPSAKMTGDDVRKVRGMRGLGFSLKDIARQFSISTTQAHDIARGKSWGHIK